MRNLKRALSLVMAMALIVGMMVVSASAVSVQDFTDADEIQHTEAVNTMVALNVIDGKEDGSYYDPTGTLTRAEMAKIVAFIMNGGVEPNIGTKLVPTYGDIDNHWAEAYIEYCTSMGIIAGDGAGNFNPGGTLTASQAAKMFLTAIGYNANVFGLVGNDWETNTNRYANEAGLYDELGGVSVSAPISRDNAAQMAYNAIQATLMVRSWNQDMQTGEITEGYRLDESNRDLLLTRFNAVMQYGYMDSASYNEDRDEYTYTFTADGSTTDFDGIEVTVDPVGGSTGSLFLTTDLDVSNLYGHRVKVIYKNNSARDVYGIYASESEVLASAVVGDLPDDLAAADTSMSVNDVTYRFDTNAGFTNLVSYLGDDIDTMAALSGQPLEWNVDLVDNDGDGRVNFVMAYPFTVAKVSYVGTDSFNTAANSVMGVTANTGIKFDDVNVYEGIAKDDYVKIVPAANSVDGDVTYTKIDDIVEGEVTAVSSGSVEVDGESYSFDTDNASYGLSNSYKFVLVNGYVCASEGITTGADLSEYALVTGVENATGVRSAQAKLIFTDGSSEIVDTDQYYSAYASTPTLVTFEIEDGEYKLTSASTLTDGANGTSGFDVKLSTLTYAYASSGRSTIGGEFISDDAVIFVMDSAGNFDVISGSALKRYSAGVTVTNAFANKASTGFNNVVLAYVNLAGTVAKATENYGYVTSGLSTVKNDDNETVSRLSMWTPDGQLTNILADENLSGTVAKGSVVTYEVNDDGSYTIDVANVNRAAILAYNEANGTIRFTDSTLVDGAGNVNGLEISSDTVILYINSNDVAGVEGGEIATAVETATDDLYQANAYYFTSNGTELDVVIVDVYADLPAMPGTYTSEATTQAALQAELNSNASVRFDASQLTGAASVTLPEGGKLTVTNVDATYALTVSVADGATLDMSQVPDTATADMLVANVQPGGTFIYDNGALMGEGGYFDSTAAVTIKNDGDDLKVTLAGTVTLKKDLIIGAGDTIDGTATIVGDDAGRTIVVRNETKISDQDSSNFYSDDGTVGAVENATYKWTLDCNSATEGNQNGWMKQ